MSDSERNPDDAKYCPSCGEPLPFDSVRFYGDNLPNRYRTVFECPSCGYDGEVIRGGGIEDMSLELVKNDGNPMVPTPGGDSHES